MGQKEQCKKCLEWSGEETLNPYFMDCMENSCEKWKSGTYRTYGIRRTIYDFFYGLYLFFTAIID